MLGAEVYVYQQDFPFAGLGKCRRQASGESGRAGSGGETGYSNQLRLMGELIEFEVKANAIPERFAIGADEMMRVPGSNGCAGAVLRGGSPVLVRDREQERGLEFLLNLERSLEAAVEQETAEDRESKTQRKAASRRGRERSCRAGR